MAVLSPFSTEATTPNSGGLTTHHSTRLVRGLANVNIAGVKGCNMNDQFGWIIQGILAFVAFSTLILKRYREPPNERREVIIWFYDTSKQAVGAVVIHFANVLLSTLFRGDPCTWYLINFLLDSTLGLLIIYFFLKLILLIVRLFGWQSLRFGEYGTPPKCSAWMGQCGLYLIVVVLEKVSIALLVHLPFWQKVREFILKPIEGHPKVELAVVMLIVPFIINAIMFWVVDNFLMLHKKKRSLKPKDDSSIKVKYQKTTDMTHSEEAAVLLEDELEDDYTVDEIPYNARETLVRR